MPRHWARLCASSVEPTRIGGGSCRCCCCCCCICCRCVEDGSFVDREEVNRSVTERRNPGRCGDAATDGPDVSEISPSECWRPIIAGLIFDARLLTSLHLTDAWRSVETDRVLTPLSLLLKPRAGDRLDEATEVSATLLCIELAWVCCVQEEYSPRIDPSSCSSSAVTGPTAESSSPSAAEPLRTLLASEGGPRGLCCVYG